MRRLVPVLLLSLAATGAAAPPKPKPRTTPPSKPAPPPDPPPTAEPAPAPAPPPARPPALAPPVVPATGKPRMIVLGLTAAGGVEPALAESLTESVAAELSRTRLFEVTSQKDIASVLGVERQRQLLGCQEEAASCLAELAGALGARFIVSGSVARLGDVYQLNLQTQDTVKTQTLGRATRLASDLSSLRTQLPFAIAEATATPAPEPPSKVLPAVLLGSGAAVAVGAGVVFLLASSREQTSLDELALARTQPQLQLRPASYYRDEAAAVTTMRWIGAAGAAVGAALVVTGIVVYPREASVALVPTGGGAALVGTWP